MQKAWEMTKEDWEIYTASLKRQLIADWNAAGSKGFPPSLGYNSIYKRIEMGERARFELPRQADELLRIPHHELSVMVAMAEGEQIPADVLAQYPHLERGVS